MNAANLIFVEECGDRGYNIRLNSVRGCNYSQALQWISKTYGPKDRIARYTAVTVAQHFLDSLLDSLEELTGKEYDDYCVKLIQEGEVLDEGPNYKDYSDYDK